MIPHSPPQRNSLHLQRQLMRRTAFLFAYIFSIRKRKKSVKKQIRNAFAFRISFSLPSSGRFHLGDFPFLDLLCLVIERAVILVTGRMDRTLFQSRTHRTALFGGV